MLACRYLGRPSVFGEDSASDGRDSLSVGRKCPDRTRRRQCRHGPSRCCGAGSGLVRNVLAIDRRGRCVSQQYPPVGSVPTVLQLQGTDWLRSRRVSCSAAYAISWVSALQWIRPAIMSRVTVRSTLEEKRATCGPADLFVWIVSQGGLRC